jgi:hypothetical protein
MFEASRRSGLLATVLLGACLSACNGGSSGLMATGSTATVPGAPTIGTATAGNDSATIAFSAPTSDGGAAITGYTATCSAGGASKTGTGTSSPLTVASLVNGTAYSCTVTATNSVGTGAASASVSVTPTAATGTSSTASVDCPYSENTYEATDGLTSDASWTCSSSSRVLTANGLPDHPVGTFPNTNDPNTISAQPVSFSATLTPTVASSATAGSESTLSYALNGVKFDPATAGTCPTGATATSNCSLIGDSGDWSIEAIGQSVFDFGVDSNNAHVQPNGAYHYHGMPTGILNNNGVSSTNVKMLLVGFAPDGFPIYARYGHSTATDASSALKVMTSSYALKTTPDSGRPPTSVFPMGTFTQDYEYVAGSGDLDQCNGRFDVTPEFPNGIYHYYATDTWPYLTRYWCGTVG